MAYDGAFTPKGPTVLVGVNPVQAPTTDGTTATSYRIRALLATSQYMAWAAPTVAVPAIALVAPTAGVPSSPNTIGFLTGTTETLVLPAGCWMRADAPAAFEVTPGEGV